MFLPAFGIFLLAISAANAATLPSPSLSLLSENWSDRTETFFTAQEYLNSKLRTRTPPTEWRNLLSTTLQAKNADERLLSETLQSLIAQSRCDLAAPTLQVIFPSDPHGYMFIPQTPLRAGTYARAIKLASHCRDAKSVHAFFKLAKSLPPSKMTDLIIPNTLLKSFALLNDFRSFQEVLDWILKGLNVAPDAYTFTIALNGLGTMDRVEEMKGILKWLERYHIRINVNVLNAIIGVAMKRNCKFLDQQVMRTLNRFEQLHLKPDTYTVNELLHFFGRRANLKGVLDTAKLIARVKVDHMTYKTLMDALFRAGVAFKNFPSDLFVQSPHRFHGLPLYKYGDCSDGHALCALARRPAAGSRPVNARNHGLADWQPS